MSELYAEIERLTRELEEERELHLTARRQSDAYEMGMESWKGGYERLTRELEMQQLVENRLRLSWDESDKEAKRLRAALEQMYSAHRSIGFHSRKMKWTHCNECDAYREALGEPKP